MRVLLLGGTGAMGESLAKILANREYDITISSRRTRASEKPNISYIKGNAHDLDFLKNTFKERYDVIIDFMVYSTNEFEEKRELLLDSADQYFFLSSSRVYSGSSLPIEENFPRLLDTSTDRDYLKTDEYALAKARQEDLLFNSNKKNWTIIRPYITYNTHRLQLGTMEKENWLWRLLKGRPIVFPKALLNKKTTLTYAEDVATAIFQLIGNNRALGQAYHITADDSLTWEQVLCIYEDILTKKGYKFHVTLIDSPEEFAELFLCRYQLFYDRMYDRVFNNNKIKDACGPSLKFTPTKKALGHCLSEFLVNPSWRNISARAEARMDKNVAKFALLSDFPSLKKKLAYLVYRMLPL